MSLRLAVFDMVGTTVHAGDEVPRAFGEAFLSVGIAVDEVTIRGIRGRSKREAIQRLLARHGRGDGSRERLVETVYARFQEVLREAYRSGARAVDGAESTFRLLRAAGVQVALSTGLDRGTARSLVRALGWEGIGLLDVLTGDDVLRGRPAPDLIYAAMERASVDDAGEVAAIGDTTADLDAAAAARAGWRIGVLTGAHTREELASHDPSVVLPSVAALPDWLIGTGIVPGPR